jgi:transposase
MEQQQPTVEEMITAPDFSPEQLGAKFWYEQYLHQKEQYEQLAQKVLKLDEELKKLKNRTSKNSSQPPSQDNYKKKKAVKTGKKKGPKYDHKGTTRNGFAIVDRQVKLGVCECPECGSGVSKIPGAVVKREQIAELVSKPVEVTEYERALHQFRTPEAITSAGTFRASHYLRAMAIWGIYHSLTDKARISRSQTFFG